MHIGNNLKLLRKSRGLTQENLANQLNKHPVSISDYEKGKSVPPIEVALQLCDIFGLDLNDLVLTDLSESDLFPVQVKERKEPYVAEKDLKKQLETLQKLTKLQEHRLNELEREIREHAPRLAERLKLEKED